MKCDELQAIESATAVIENVHLVYRKSEVDSAIDQLKREHHKERDEYIDMVAQHKEKLVEQESENRRLKRALWMARKAHAVAMVAYWDSHYRDNPNAVYRNRTIDWLRNRWLLILDAIIKKEKEYK